MESDPSRSFGRVAVVASVCEEAMEGQALAGVMQAFGPDVAITTEPNDTRLGIGQRGRANDRRGCAFRLLRGQQALFRLR